MASALAILERSMAISFALGSLVFWQKDWSACLGKEAQGHGGLFNTYGDAEQQRLKKCIIGNEAL